MLSIGLSQAGRQEVIRLGGVTSNRAGGNPGWRVEAKCCAPESMGPREKQRAQHMEPKK